MTDLGNYPDRPVDPADEERGMQPDADRQAAGGGVMQDPVNDGDRPAETAGDLREEEAFANEERAVEDADPDLAVDPITAEDREDPM